ncbi:MAG: GspE/PulE family protein, partial [Methylomonas sp.]
MAMDIADTVEPADIYADFIERLKQNGYLSDNDLNKVKRLQSAGQDDVLPIMLIRLGICSEQDIANTFSILTNIEHIAADSMPDQAILPDSVSLRFLKQYHLVGIAKNQNDIMIAVVDPLDDYIVHAMKLATGHNIVLKIACLSDIDSALEHQYGQGKSEMDKLKANFSFDEDNSNDDLEHLKDLASEAPIIKMVNLILQKAVENLASDIHIEPFEDSLKVRLRIDGMLHDIDSPPVSSTAAVLSRIKIMAKLNIAERRLPQDGRIKLQIMGKELDLRVSTIPTLFGESVVIRLLDQDNAILDFARLGFVGKHAQQFMDLLTRPHGIILITGPTGSGKSTTLYAALKTLNTSERKIITVEDPVEYQLEGINQIQAKPQIGLTFASALRSIVRQ